LVWAQQADANALSRNQELRQQYTETGGEGMSTEDIERAKILIARDKRKKEKRGSKVKQPANDAVELVEQKKDKTARAVEKANLGRNGKVSERAQRDRNETLRKLYIETGGKGMKPEQLARAKLLVERQERKRRKRKNQDPAITH